MDVIDYRTPAGVNPLKEWLDGLEDLQAIAVILRRIDRLKRGNLGDCRFCGEGVWELRIDFGPGYRIYYARLGKAILLLLRGGSKQSQAGDIVKAISYWRDFQRRQCD